MEGLNLISLNVRGIRDRVKRKTIFDWVRTRRADVVMLQETYSTPDIIIRSHKNAGFRSFRNSLKLFVVVI